MYVQHQGGDDPSSVLKRNLRSECTAVLVPCARCTLMDPRGLWASLARLASVSRVWLVGALVQ
jgi:hypothetical protein